MQTTLPRREARPGDVETPFIKEYSDWPVAQSRLCKKPNESRF
jgi:hypothetical protein